MWILVVAFVWLAPLAHAEYLGDLSDNPLIQAPSSTTSALTARSARPVSEMS
ncbi:hypothetical protein [Nitrospira japonica]|uniref:hypothetical protein n=1 Tax=Nitrospira japonica TaxID=1325564 RepID=UPI001560B6E3|nr:hypothetical protein [Nitrospira japonica]